MKLLTTLIQIALYLICYAFIITAFKNFAYYALYSYFGIESEAFILNIEKKKSIYGSVKYVHHYQYRIGDGVKREGKLARYNEEFKENEKFTINYVKGYPDLSHYPQQNKELIATLTYSIIGLVMLYMVNSYF